MAATCFPASLYGGRYSISVGLATVTLALLTGSIIGIVLGYVGGRIDEWGSRLHRRDARLPADRHGDPGGLVLGVGLVNVVIAVAIACVPRFARVIRGAVLVVKEQPFIEAARALGAGDIRIMLRHLLPNAVPTARRARHARTRQRHPDDGDAELSWPRCAAAAPEWGAMLNSGREYMRYAPWIMIFPGLALFLAVMAVNLLGDRLSQVLDPRSVDRKSMSASVTQPPLRLRPLRRPGEDQAVVRPHEDARHRSDA